MKLPSIDGVAHLPMVDKDGKITNEWRVYHHQLVQTLQLFLHDEGYLMPALNQDQINTINNASYDDQKVYRKRLVYNDNTNRLMVNNDGTFKNITTE